MIRELTIALCLLPSFGCYSFTSVGRARTMPAGRIQAFAAPEPLIVATRGGVSIRPVADLGARYGLVDDVELDARVTTLGLTLGPRLQLTRSPSLKEGIDVLLSPALAYTYPDKLALEASASLGLNFPGDMQLILSPRIVYQARIGTPGFARPVSFLMAGGSLGLALRITDALTILPEAALFTQIYAEPGFSTNVSNALGAQGAIGVLYDF
jgi:hypothetical protein